MKLREYKSEDSKIICSWIKDEKTLFQWSADRIGKFPLLGNELNESYDQANISKDFFPLIAIDENNNVIGHLFIRIPDPEKKEIVRFGFVIIAPELRRSGNGKKMLELALEYAKINLKATKVTLGVFENNPKAQKCYESVGFIPVSKSKINILKTNWVCIDMELNLV